MWRQRKMAASMRLGTREQHRDRPCCGAQISGENGKSPNSLCLKHRDSTCSPWTKSMTDSHFVACIIHSPCHKTRRYIKEKVWGGTVIKKLYALWETGKQLEDVGGWNSKTMKHNAGSLHIYQ